MNQLRNERPTDFGPRPREFLESALRSAIQIRKLLAMKPQLVEVQGRFASAADALALAELIETMCEMGRNANAEDAILIAEKVELLIDRLWTEIDFILAARNHGAEE